MRCPRFGLPERRRRNPQLRTEACGACSRVSVSAVVQARAGELIAGDASKIFQRLARSLHAASNNRAPQHLEQLMGRFRLKQELAIAYETQPWPSGRINR